MVYGRLEIEGEDGSCIRIGLLLKGMELRRWLDLRGCNDNVLLFNTEI